MRSGISRRRMLRGAVVGVTGSAGLAVLAACGETQVVTKEVPIETTVIKEVPVEKIVRETEIREVPVEKIVTQQVDRIVTQTVEVEKVVEKVVTETVEVEKVVEKVVEVMVEAQPVQRTVKLEYATDHTSGPRGQAMQWAIERWEQIRPDVKIKFIPQDHIFYEKIAVEVAADTLSEINLLSGHSYGQFLEAGAWLESNDLLAKKDGFVPEDYLFSPDEHSDNRDQNNYGKWNKVMNGPMHGMMYQGGINGLLYNIDAVAAAGAREPWDGMRFDELLEEMKKVTDHEQGIWGSDAGLGTAFNCALGYNDSQRRVMGPEGHQVDGYFIDDGWQGLQWVADLMFVHNVAFRPEQRAEISGEIGSPFAAGNQVFWWGGRFRTVGFAIPRIKDRFRWSLAPLVWGNVTDHPNPEYGNQPNIFAASAAVTGVEEQTVDFGVYLAGPEVQGRVGIDRGHQPVHHDVKNQPDAVAPPPEGLHHLYAAYDSPYLRHSQWYVPGGPTMLELLQVEGPLLGKALVGEATATEAIEEATNATSAIMKRWQERLDRGDVAR